MYENVEFMHPNPNPKMKWTNKSEIEPKQNVCLTHNVCKINFVDTPIPYFLLSLLLILEVKIE